jgi:hypothetical protein
VNTFIHFFLFHPSFSSSRAGPRHLAILSSFPLTIFIV